MNHAGLSSTEIQALGIEYGKNTLPSEKLISKLGLFFSQFKNPLVYIICLVGLVSFFLKRYLDVGLILSTVILNALFGFFQEYKTQKELLALKKLLKPRAKVIRGGRRQEIDAAEIVPGDVAVLIEGDKIPADGELLETASFFVNEAILTGESESIEKKEKAEVFMGTIVASGRAIMRVKKIGAATKIGQIAQSLKETPEPPTTLQIRLKKLSQTIIYISILLSLGVFVLGIIARHNLLEILQMAAVLLVSVIPEALLIVVTLILVIGMRRILKKKALVRKLSAVETLGSVTTICTDKTGTLTEGKMRIDKVELQDLKYSWLAMCLCNDLADPAEITLWDYLEKQKDFQPQETFEKYQRIFEIPFKSEYKFMATANCLSAGSQEECLMFVKGAAEIVLLMCDLTKEKKEVFLRQIEIWGNDGLKVFGLAYCQIQKKDLNKIKVDNMPTLHWLGIIGLWDPPRPEVKETIATIKKAGIKIKVVTGDYRPTSEKIMKFVGINVRPEEIIESQELENLSDEELKKRVGKTLLFTRVTPLQKLRIVNALQANNEVVAMTGDGVNDAPALKKANIGIVVNEASEVAKETADIVLLDNNLKTIITAVEEGRTLFENLKKIIFFMLSNSFAEVALIFGAILLGWPLPLTIAQILWLHLLCDGPEDVVLGFEPKEKEVMSEGPKKITEPILDKPRQFLILAISTLTGLASLWLFWHFGLKQNNLELGRTLAFMTIASNAVIYIFACRSFRKPFWRYENFWSNKWLFAAVIFSLLLQLCLPYLSLTQKILSLTPLKIMHWLIVLAVGLFVLLLIESVKAITTRSHRKITN